MRRTWERGVRADADAVLPRESGRLGHHVEVGAVEAAGGIDERDERKEGLVVALSGREPESATLQAASRCAPVPRGDAQWCTGRTTRPHRS